MTNLELAVYAIALRWVIFEYKLNAWFLFWLATAGTPASKYTEKIPALQNNAIDGVISDVPMTSKQWLSLMKQVGTSPAAIAESLGNKVRATLLECVFCQTVEVATVLVVVHRLVDAEVWAIISQGLLLLSVGFLGLTLFPVIDWIVSLAENGFIFDIYPEDEDH